MNRTYILLITRDGIEKVEEIPQAEGGLLPMVWKRAIRSRKPAYADPPPVEFQTCSARVYRITGEQKVPDDCCGWKLPVYREEE